MVDIILASKSKVREKILKDCEIICSVKPSNIDEEPIKYSLLKEGATPEMISKNLAELKANKVSNNIHETLVLGADSVIDLNGELISKPENRISDEDLYAYNVYQIEGEGKKLFTKIDGDENTVMGLPVKRIKDYLNNYK